MGYGGYFEPDIAVGFDALTEFTDGVAVFILVFLMAFMLILMALSVLIYVLQSVGLYTIAKRRGIHNPWLAWIPVGNMWVLGSISDQYQYLVKGKERSRRKVLVGLMIGMYALIGVYFALQTASIIGIVVSEGAVAGATLGVGILVYIALMVLTIVAIVFQYMAMYDLFASCEPDNAVAFLILSIVVSISYPILIFIVRNKDKGMPARRVRAACEPTEEPVYEQPQPLPEATDE